MLGLSFQVAGQRFAVDCRMVAEVIPLVELRPLLPAVPGVRGLATWRGRPLPVIDLGSLLAGEPCADRLSTRVIVASAGGVRVGLVAEQATDVVTLDEGALRDPGIRVPGAPFLGPLAQAPGGTIQVLSLADLLPPATLALLAAQEAT